jgi:CpXC protein
LSDPKVSDLQPGTVTCPECQHAWTTPLFQSLNGDIISAQLREILEGTFEQQECSSCGALFRPEHPMLYSQLSTQTWIVMHPPVDRARYAVIERGVALVMERNLAAAPPGVIERMREVQPRLVFGQSMLTEALRVSRAGLSPALLECAKLLALRRNLAELLRYGPSQLLFEAREDDGRLRCAVVEFDHGKRMGELWLPATAITEVQAAQTAVVQLYPELFTQAYVSACRYLT